MNEGNIIQKIKEYCNYYEKKSISNLDLVDIVCLEMFHKEAFLTNKVGKRIEHNITQQEADRISEYVKYMESKKLIFREDKYFRVAKELLN